MCQQNGILIRMKFPSVSCSGLGQLTVVASSSSPSLSIAPLLFPGEKNIDEAINTLDKESVDVLMKYIYRLFEAPQEKNYALVLTWHDRAFKVGGHGAILRTMTDRKHV